jgi:hypothetical protein
MGIADRDGDCAKGRRAMRRATVLIALLAFVVLTGSASAYTYAESRYGNVLPLIDGRSLGLGGAGIASSDGVRGMSLNPALLGKTDGIELCVSGLVIGSEESREIPLHDSFDGIIGYNTFALNTAFYDHYVGGVAFNPPAEYEWAPTVAIGYRPRLDMNYTYHVQYRDPDTQAEPADKILYDYYVDGDGGVNAFTVALGQEVAPDVYVGLAIDVLRGESDVTERWVYPPNSEGVDVDSRAEYNDLTGAQFALGVLVERLHRLDVGFVYRPGFELEGESYVRQAGEDVGSTEDFMYEYPQSFAIGLEYHPRNQLRTSVCFDVEYTKWSDFEIGKGAFIEGLYEVVGRPDLDDTLVYRVGVEHSFFDNTLARFGFLYEPSYVDERNTRAAFSAGLGLDILGVRVDLAGQVGVREYDIDEGRIRETTTLAMATVVHSF